MADPADIAHLLRRTEYVARPARVTALSIGTLEAAVDDVLNISATPVALPQYLTYHDDNNGYDQYVYAIQWWFDRMVDAPKPMHEKMTFFWHGHLCSGWDKVSRTDAMMGQNKIFRDQAFGNFRSMVHAVALQPAMLLYLDNIDNVVGSPNQNFARELMELFTMGVGNYTEQDVAAAAAAWTGYGIDWDTYQFEYHSGDHDNSFKLFFGKSARWTGPQIIDEILTVDAAKKLVTCKYLTKKLWEHFAYQNPSQALIDELAQVLYDNDLAIKPWVKAMLMHAEFYSTTAKQGMVRTPVDFVVAVLHHTGLRSATVNPQWSVEGMGQVPYVPPNVSGWRPNGYWINTSVLGGRAEFARSITWRLRSNDGHDITDLSIDDAIAYMATLFSIDFSATTHAALTEFLQTQRLNEPWGGWWESTNLLTMAMICPEFHVA